MIAKNGWDIIERARLQRGKVAPLRMYGLDGSVMEFGPEWFRKDGSIGKKLQSKIAELRRAGILAQSKEVFICSN